MMPKHDKVIITNEDEAWVWLKNAIDKVGFDEHTEVEFKGWPNLEIIIRGRDFRGTMPTRIMPAILDLQKEVHRACCLLKYGESNTRKLTDEDREHTELVVKIGKGSSRYNVDISNQLTEIFTKAVSKMDSSHIAITLIGLGLTVTAGVMWKAWLKHKERIHDIDSRVLLSDLEKQKIELFSDARRKTPEIKVIQEGADEFRNSSLLKLKDNDCFVLGGSDFEIDGVRASEITHKPREQSIEVRLDGEFLIQSVESGGIRGFKIKVQRVRDQLGIVVTIPDMVITTEQKEILKNNEWAKRPVLMEINARQLRGAITSATLVSVQQIERRRNN